MHKIAVLPGDGTGPEVVAEGLKALDAVARKTNFKYETANFDFGGDRYLRTSEVLPDSAVDDFRGFDAIYLGAIGHPGVKPGILEKGILLRLRFELDQYINLRPVKPLSQRGYSPQGQGTRGHRTSWWCARTRRESIPALAVFTKKGTPDEVAVQESINTRKGVERCVRYAFDYTRNRNRKKTLTLCGKTNVLTFAFDLWERTFNEVGEADYGDIDRDYAHVDAICMWMVKNPEWFDVIVTDNIFGDIITDLGAMIQGGMGIAAGGNINPDGVSMFEPIGGSAPKYTGKNVINPMAAIAACQLLLDVLGEAEGARILEDAIVAVLGRLEDMGAGRMGFSTTEAGGYGGPGRGRRLGRWR